MPDQATTTTIRIEMKTKERLKTAGTMGDSFDTVINKLLDNHESSNMVPLSPWKKTPGKKKDIDNTRRIH